MTDEDVAYVSTRQYNRDRRIHTDPDCVRLKHSANMREVDPDQVDWPVCKTCTGEETTPGPDYSHYNALRAAAEADD